MWSAQPGFTLSLTLPSIPVTCRAGYSLVKRSSKGGHTINPIERCVVLKQGRA
ncbi:hypothetical protein PGT21_028676 [Puccinia graminis f. sp. tritici]|uniref:Uncharacterized protein n=1 Tax=Puccinia graminis f. sp. tritici TaxID=56615 RepID=A0A5B0MDZ5_PUCGR|nr:hypothetical protein PGT21_028676 [Puccinia graminis f. sp. tritici]